MEVMPERLLIRDTDKGAELQEQVERIQELVKAYRKGWIKEQY